MSSTSFNDPYTAGGMAPPASYSAGDSGKTSYARRVKPGSDSRHTSQATLNPNNVQSSFAPVRESGMSAQQMNQGLPDERMPMAQTILTEAPGQRYYRDSYVVQQDAYAEGELPAPVGRDNPLRYHNVNNYNMNGGLAGLYGGNHPAPMVAMMMPGGFVPKGMGMNPEMMQQQQQMMMMEQQQQQQMMMMMEMQQQQQMMMTLEQQQQNGGGSSSSIGSLYDQ